MRGVNRIINSTLRNTYPARCYTTQPNFKKKTFEFIKDLKSTEVPIKELDLEVANLKSSIFKTKQIVDAHLQQGEFALVGDDVSEIVLQGLKENNLLGSSEALVEVEEQNITKRKINFEKVYEAVKLIHEHVNRGGRQAQVPRLIDPLLRSQTDFPDLYMMPVHLAKVLTLYRKGDKQACLEKLESLKQTCQKMYSAALEKIEQKRLQKIALTAVTEEERQEREKQERSKLDVYDQTIIPPERSISNYKYSLTNEPIPEFDALFGAEQDLQHVLVHLDLFTQYEKIIHHEISHELDSELTSILQNVDLKETRNYFIASGIKANLSCLDGNLNDALIHFESCLRGLDDYKELTSLKQMWQVMYWNVQYQLEMRNPSQDLLNMVQMIDPNYSKNINQYKKVGRGKLPDAVTRWLCLQVSDLLTQRGRLTEASTFIQRGLDLSYEGGLLNPLYAHFLSRKAHVMGLGIKLQQGVNKMDQEVEYLFEKSLQIGTCQNERVNVLLVDRFLQYLKNRRPNSGRVSELQSMLDASGQDLEYARREQVFGMLFSNVILPYADAPVLFEK